MKGDKLGENNKQEKYWNDVGARVKVATIVELKIP
jgi:hypothetical protein